MPRIAQRMTAADLLVYGTFVLRRSLHQIARPTRRAAPGTAPSSLQPHKASTEAATTKPNNGQGGNGRRLAGAVALPPLTWPRA
jgi:hypothetical protein